MSQQHVTLESLGSGAASEVFQHELKKVLENILDINTDAKATRSLTLKVTVKPNDKRDSAAVTMAVSSKMAPVRNAETTIFIGRKVSGEVVALESNPKQLTFDDQLKPKAAVVNMSTGEVTE